MAMSQVEGDAPLELIVRSREYFDLMEPVLVELRLRNLLTDLPVVIDKRLAPEFGGIVVYIQKPDGHIVQYDPVMCAVGTPEPHVLAPSGAGEPGQDRLSREVFLSYGSSEFYFDRPGEYRIRAVYQGSGDVLIPSEAHRIRIGLPISKDADRLAQDYFSHEVGLSLYLQGSRSPFLVKGTAVIENLANRFKDTVLGAKLALTLAHGVAQPFKRVHRDDPEHARIERAAQADPKRALEITEPALGVLRADKDKALNLTLARAVRRRATYHEALGDAGRAAEELNTLQSDLAARGANASVLEGYRALAASIGGKEPAGDGGRGASARKRGRAASRRRG
jgi:hypothetical protein